MHVGLPARGLTQPGVHPPASRFPKASRFCNAQVAMKRAALKGRPQQAAAPRKPFSPITFDDENGGDDF